MAPTIGKAIGVESAAFGRDGWRRMSSVATAAIPQAIHNPPPASVNGRSGPTAINLSRVAVHEGDPAEITVVIADDHQVVRSGLRLLLQGEPGMHVVGETGDVPGALRMVEARRPDVLVLDLNMPGPPSLAAIPEFQAICESTRIVVLTMQDQPAYARESLQNGASAYVLKEAAGEELVRAVRTAAAGGTYLNPGLGARLAAAPVAPERPDTLSDREVEILQLIALGHTNAEIGTTLFISTRTVETHRAHLQQKLGKSTRAELVRYAIDRGLVD